MNFDFWICTFKRFIFRIVPIWLLINLVICKHLETLLCSTNKIVNKQKISTGSSPHSLWFWIWRIGRMLRFLAVRLMGVKIFNGESIFVIFQNRIVTISWTLLFQLMIFYILMRYLLFISAQVLLFEFFNGDVSAPKRIC